MSQQARSRSPMSQPEFIALVAMLFATIAFSIDAMLPALPEIASELTPDDVNRAQLILTSFVLGMGVGTFLAGPLSDTFGRKRIILFGALLYVAGAALAWAAQSLELVLAARVLQGLGAAGPRIATLALVRDLYSGRQMARVVSFAMMVFTLVPAVAPALGTLIIAVTGWRGIFGAFILFAGTAALWLHLRQPETLMPEARRPLRLSVLWEAIREVLGHRVIVTSIVVQTLGFGALFGTISSVQQVFAETFDRAEGFPFWFALVALVAGNASVINAMLVVRLGMRLLVTVTYAWLAVFSLLVGLCFWAELLPAPLAFVTFLIWMVTVFSMAGLTIGNLNALALEPVGHIAGMAASITGALATVFAVLIAAPIGLAFNGTTLPLIFSVATLAALSFGLMKTLPQRT